MLHHLMLIVNVTLSNQTIDTVSYASLSPRYMLNISIDHRLQTYDWHMPLPTVFKTHNHIIRITNITNPQSSPTMHLMHPHTSQANDPKTYPET